MYEVLSKISDFHQCMSHPIGGHEWSGGQYFFALKQYPKSTTNRLFMQSGIMKIGFRKGILWQRKNDIRIFSEDRLRQNISRRKDFAMIPGSDIMGKVRSQRDKHVPFLSGFIRNRAFL